MKYFKVKAKRIADRYEIDIANFIKHTENKFPFVQSVSTNKVSQFAICPSCLNPIQLVGIDRKISCSPYGRHTGKNVIGLPKWSYVKYQYCPFADKDDRRKPTDNERLEVTEDVVELYNLLKTQFDRVIYVIKNELMIDCSPAFWRKALQQFISSNGYCYPWLTDANLPYVFAYIGMQHSLLFGQKFIVNTDLYNVLSRQNNSNFVFLEDKDGNALKNSKYRRLSSNGYMKYHFRFTAHKQKAIEGKSLNETMDFCVDDMRTNTEIYKRCISFDENRFINIVRKTGNEDKRQQWLLDIANELMPPLACN